MKILNVKTFSYSEESKDKWTDIIFRPIKDYKFSIQLKDGHIIECASFELIENNRHEMHACVSTQAGCKFACHFCVSGKQGFIRNLTDEEIFGQLALMSNFIGISHFDHIVYMGIGEPLNNFTEVHKSIQLIIQENPWYSGRISIATVGVINSLKILTELQLPLRMLWWSLHAPTDEKRTKIMPLASKNFPIQQTLNALIEFAEKTTTETWVNYMILHEFNDLDEDAQNLANLLQQAPQLLNVMITIPNGIVDQFSPGTILDALMFEKKLIALGVKNRIAKFFAAGRPIKAGCGEFIFLPS